MNLDFIKIFLEILTSLITIIGAPIAVFLYFKDKKKERLDREYGTYNALDDKYIDFLNLCLENVDLGIYDMNVNENLTKEQLIRRNILFEILICLFERAFLMYRNHDKLNKQQQWLGWNAYVEDWFKVKSFREVWAADMNSQYDLSFLNYMNSIYSKKANIEND